MFARFVIVLSVLVMFASCATQELRQPPQNNSKFFRDGFPEVTLNTLGLVNLDDKSAINVFVQIANKSIIALQDKDRGKQASLTIEIRLSGNLIGVNGTFSKSFEIDLSEQIAKNPDGYFDFKQQFLVPSGFCKVVVQVTDNQSQKVATVSAQTFVPDPESKDPAVTSVVVLVKEPKTKEYNPYLSTAIPARYDTLQFFAQVFPGIKEITAIKLHVDRFLSDTLPARRLFEQNILPGQLEYLGLDYSKKTTVLERDIKGYDPKSKIIELTEFVKTPSIGNYRAELIIQFADTTQPISQLFEFTVKPAYFPKIRTAKELAEPLIYLMDEKDHAKIMANKNPDSLKRAVDKFWLNFLGDANLARQSLQLYYERVEYANRYFTTFKEGWKTDPGMLYVLFGSPRIVDLMFRDVIWAYGMYQNNSNFDPELTFLFTRIITQYSNFPYEHYIIRRSPNYFQTNFRIIESWDNGLNLIK